MKHQIAFRVDTKPIGTNSAYKKRPYGHGLFMTEEAKAYKKAVGEWAQIAMNEAGLEDFWLERPEVNLVFTYGDKRKRDIDSAIKLTLDAMNKVVWKDDSEILRLVVRKQYKKDSPSVAIVVTGH